ncbi:unnamed protein product [Dracunculus medinensis]|uniref:Uncharacterized protein n=1 Tax=Dracunculus medinensis TaxID=318479 RepID=A0A0N4UC31_DRAME|nr:unnamed protein product [Dracunculus medinensis]
MTNSANTITIEDQIRTIDKVLKEVKRYRDFLVYEKTRRDPALYKTANIEQPSCFNDSICTTINALTNQLAQEWIEKLKNIHATITSASMSGSIFVSRTQNDRT